MTVTRLGGSAGFGTVSYETADGVGTAVPNSDYTPISAQSLVFSPGTTKVTLIVIIQNNLFYDPGHNVVVRLLGPTGTSGTPILGARSNGSIAISGTVVTVYIFESCCWSAPTSSMLLPASYSFSKYR